MTNAPPPARLEPGPRGSSHARAILFALVAWLCASPSLSAAAGDPLAKLQKKLAFHEQKEAFALAQQLEWASAAAALASARADLVAEVEAAEQALADALLLPVVTPEEASLAKQATKAAKKALAAAEKALAKNDKQTSKALAKVAKWAAKVAKHQAAQEQLVGQIEDLDGSIPQGGGASYEPPWADVEPLVTQTLTWDPGLGPQGNGALLRSALLALQPGDRLEIGAGTWSVSSKLELLLQGTAEAPIRIVARAGETPVLTRPDASQNVLNLSVQYVAIRGLEITGGSAGIKIGSSRHLWIDDCEVHHVGETGIAANSAHTDHLWITRNEVHHTGGYGEGLYLGANDGTSVMSESVIALNHVHDTGGSQGDGIELKQGSWGNLIAENYVHDTKYPCLLVYGTGGKAPNVIERNVLLRSEDNVLQVQGEAIVRDNLVVGGETGFASHDHQGETRDLVVVHNTIVGEGVAARLTDWGGRPGMVLANNALYRSGGTAVSFSSGSAGVTIAGNVVLGGVSGASGGFAPGLGLGDFTALTWTGSSVDALPSPGSPLLGAGAAAWATAVDLLGTPREVPVDSGCRERP